MDTFASFLQNLYYKSIYSCQNFYLKSKYTLFPSHRERYEVLLFGLDNYTPPFYNFERVQKLLPNNIIGMKTSPDMIVNYPITKEIRDIINMNFADIVVNNKYTSDNPNNHKYTIDVPRDVPDNHKNQYCDSVGEFISRSINTNSKHSSIKYKSYYDIFTCDFEFFADMKSKQ